jgi:hypothetical protein
MGGDSFEGNVKRSTLINAGEACRKDTVIECVFYLERLGTPVLDLLYLRRALACKLSPTPSY